MGSTFSFFCFKLTKSSKSQIQLPTQETPERKIYFLAIQETQSGQLQQQDLHYCSQDKISSFIFSESLWGWLLTYSHFTSGGVTSRLGSSCTWNKVLLLVSESKMQKPAMLLSKSKNMLENIARKELERYYFVTMHN